jgi:isopenicillin N synthase-like dioxygenase
VIDVGPLLREEGESTAVTNVINSIVAAARTGSAGFFTITGHGVHMASIEQVAQDFFRWPMEEKMALAPHLYNANNSHRFRGCA